MNSFVSLTITLTNLVCEEVASSLSFPQKSVREKRKTQK